MAASANAVPWARSQGVQIGELQERARVKHQPHKRLPLGSQGPLSRLYTESPGPSIAAAAAAAVAVNLVVASPSPDPAPQIKTGTERRKPGRRPLFAAYDQDAQGQSEQEKQQRNKESLAWLSCGKSFDPTLASQYPGLTERHRELQKQQQSLLLGEYAAEKAAKERLAQAEAALVAGEISLERDEREHRKQLKLRQQKAQQQQHDDYEEGLLGRPCERLQQRWEQQQQRLEVVPASGRRRESGSSSDESVVVIEPSSALVSSCSSSNIRERKQGATSLSGGDLVSPSVLKALDEGEAKRPTIWDSHRMQRGTATVAIPPHRKGSKHQQQQRARGLAADRRQQGAQSSSSSSSSSSGNVAAEPSQGGATSFPVDRRRQGKAVAAAVAVAAGAESSVGQEGVFSVFVEGLDAPLVFAAGADSRLKDIEAASASSSDDGDDDTISAECWQQQQQQQDLLLLQQQDKLLMLCRQKPRDVGLWVQLVVLQEQQLLLQQPLLLSAVPQEQLLLRQQDVLDVACSGAHDLVATGGAAAAAAAAAAPPELLVLRRLLLLRQTKTPLSDPAWLRTASLVAKLTVSLECSSSSSKTSTTTALARCLCSSAAVTPRSSEASLRLLLSQLLTSAAEPLTAATRGEVAVTETEAASIAAETTAADASAVSAVGEYRSCFALLQELLFGFSLPLEVRAGRVAAAAATAQAVAHLALLHVLRQQQLQQDEGGPVRLPTPLEQLEEIWTGRGSSPSCLRVGEVGWQDQFQHLQQSASEPAAAVYLQLCGAVDALVTATRETQKLVQGHLMQLTGASWLGGCSKDSEPSSSDSSNDSSNTCCPEACWKAKGLPGFAAYSAGDFALSALAWRSRVRGSAACGVSTAAAAADAAIAAAGSAAAAGKIAAAAAIAAADDARKVGDAAAAASAAAAAAAAQPSFAALDGLRRAADAAAAAAGAATRSAMAATTAAAAAAAADLKLPSPYGTSGDSMSAVKQWDLLRPSLLTADAVLSAAAAGVSCCGRPSSSGKGASHAGAAKGTLAATPLRRAAYCLLVGVLDFLESPTLHRFPSEHSRMQRGESASAASTNGAKLRSVALLQLRQNDPPCGDKASSSVSDSSSSSSSNSSNSAAAFSFWWPTASLTSAGGGCLVHRQTRAATRWTLAQRQLRRLVLRFYQQQRQQQQLEQQQQQTEQPRLLEDDGDALSLASSAEEATSCQALAALICAQALLAFPDDRLLLYCLLCLCPSPKMFRLVLKRNEAEPALWLTFASSLFFQAATKYFGDPGLCSSDSAAPNASSDVAADKKSPQALLLQGRKVLLTCCGAFVALAPLAASWAFLELTVGAAVPAAAAAGLSRNQKEQQPHQRVQAAANARLPPLLSYGWPWACWVGALDGSKPRHTDSSTRSSGTQQKIMQTRVPFEGWGLSAAGVHVALCSADRSFHAFDPTQPGVPHEQQQQQQQPTKDEDDGTENALVGSFGRSHLAASCAVLLQRSRIAASGAAAGAAAAATAFPLLTSAPWANLFLALLLHAALSPTPAAVWRVFEQNRGAAAAASAAAAAALDGSSCCVCCCSCCLSNISGAPQENSSSGSSSSGVSGSSSGFPLSGLCSRAEAARCEELFLCFLLVLLLTLSRISEEAADAGCAVATAETADRAAAAAQDLEVVLRASRWMLQRFTSNPFFLAVQSQGRYAQWASSSSALPFAVLQRLPDSSDGMPCATAVLQREQHLWVYLQALLLSRSSMRSYPSAVRGALEASLASLDGSFLSWLCEGLCPLEKQQSQRSETREERQQHQHREMSELEERLLQAVSQCPFSKRLWLLLLHLLHVRRRLAGAAAETALTGGAFVAEEIVLLLDEALQRGLFFSADPLAALAAP
ncbi:hypothetical protein ACSSS7_006239 [Eimeria intestinalis]